MMMRFEKQPSKFIKPLTPTPANLKHYKLGLIDEVAACINVAAVLFFSRNTNHNPKSFVVQLQKSLEKTLTRFYPLAGRFVEASQTVDCNDEGVEFIQATVDIKLEYILDPKVNLLSVDEFIPILTTKTEAVILKTQLTTFECGGVALGVSATHKVVDAATLCSFLNEWAAISREETEMKITRPVFNSSSLFPARGVQPFVVPVITDDDALSKCTRKKLSFNESVISNMKAKAMKMTGGKCNTRRLSKVQVVQSIIWKALISVDRATHDHLQESILFQSINLRERMASPLIPKYSCGNIWGVCSTKCAILETTEELASHINDSVKRTVNDLSKVCHNSEQGQTMVLDSFLSLSKIPESASVILSTSWCKFPFYEANFGLGKPIWVVPGTVPMRNTLYLIDDAEGNGVDAYVFLEVKDVPCFEDALKDLGA